MRRAQLAAVAVFAPMLGCGSGQRGAAGGPARAEGVPDAAAIDAAAADGGFPSEAVTPTDSALRPDGTALGSRSDGMVLPAGPVQM